MILWDLAVIVVHSTVHMHVNEMTEIIIYSRSIPFFQPAKEFPLCITVSFGKIRPRSKLTLAEAVYLRVQLKKSWIKCTVQSFSVSFKFPNEQRCLC